MLNIGRGHRYLLLNRADDAVGIGADKVETILGMNVAVADLDLDRHRGRHQRRHADHRGQPAPPVERGVPQPLGPARRRAGRGADLDRDPAATPTSDNDRFAKLFRIKR